MGSSCPQSCVQGPPPLRGKGLPACRTPSPDTAFPSRLSRRGEGGRSLGPLTPPRPGQQPTKTLLCFKGNKTGAGEMVPRPFAQPQLGKKPGSSHLAQLTTRASIVMNLNKESNASATSHGGPGNAGASSASDLRARFWTNSTDTLVSCWELCSLPLARAVSVQRGSNVPGPLCSALSPSRQQGRNNIRPRANGLQGGQKHAD